MVKKILVVVGILVIVALALPMFLSSNFSMSRSIEINAPSEAIFSRLTNLNEFNKWNPFPEGDPSNQTNVTGDGLNSSLYWTGDKTGEGKMTIVGVEPSKKLDIKMEFFKPMSGVGMVHWVLNPKSSSTTEMVWSFEQDLPYFNRYFGLMMDSMMGKHFEKGLVTFKNIVEASK